MRRKGRTGLSTWTLQSSSTTSITTFRCPGSRKRQLRNLRRLGLDDKVLGVATSRRGAWGVAKQPELLAQELKAHYKALSNKVLRRLCLFPSTLAAK